MRAVEKGWIASRPTRECRYDLVLDDKVKLYRVQVKYANRLASHTKGAIHLALTQSGIRKKNPYLDSEVDALIVYIAPADMLIWLETSHFHKKRQLHIRYEPGKNKQRQGILLAENYIWLAAYSVRVSALVSGTSRPGSSPGKPTRQATCL